MSALGHNAIASDSQQQQQQQTQTNYVVTKVNKLLDDMGFTKYHVVLFISNSFFLLCAGMQEIIHVILLSIINDTHKLTYYHLALMNSIEYLGYTVAAILVNVITNYISHKKAIIMFVICSLVFTGLSLTSYNYVFAAFNRFFLGICLGILDILIYLTLFESAPTKIRGFLSSIILLFFPLGAFILSTICYFQLIEGDYHLNYKMLLLIPFIITCVICLFIIVFIEDSPRRLFGLNKFEEGVETMKKITHFINKDDNYIHNDLLYSNSNNNNNIINKQIELNDLSRSKTTRDPVISIDKYVNNHQQQQQQQHSHDVSPNLVQYGITRVDNNNNNEHKKSVMNNILILFNTQYRLYTCLLWIIASFAGFVFNGIFFMLPATAPKIEKSTFLDLILFEGMEIPSNFIASLLIENKQLGRLNIIRIGFVVTFLISLLNIAIGNTVLIFDCFLKFLLTIPLNVLIVYCSEIYNSNIRTMGLSAVNFWRRIASLSAPFVMSYLTIHFGAYSTYLVYATFLCICAIASLYLKVESMGVPLDEIKKEG